MSDWLRLISMIFYAPLRGLREVRDRGSMAPVAIMALLLNQAFVAYLVWTYLRAVINPSFALSAVASLFWSSGTLICLAVVFVPLTILFTNAIDRRASFGLLFQQEYASVAATCFYALAGASVTAFVVVLFARLTRADVALGERLLLSVRQQIEQQPETAHLFDPRLLGGAMLFASLGILLLVLAFGVWAILALRIALRLSWLRAVLVVIITGIISFPVSYYLLPFFSRILASPFILLMLFFLLRGYFSGIVSSQRARAAFKQNLEAATVNPRDSSAHYNLGLIHQQRGELDQARERFQRAIDIDPDELDAHYQLGRIARAQNRLSEAIGHFEQVVQRDASHAQQEIWREIGATYLAAGQFSDAREALERFLDRRPNDPQSLYLMGRAHAGLGDSHEATTSMQACIEAVKTAPAYKYRTEKRWLNEAQQFLKRQQGRNRQESAVGS